MITGTEARFGETSWTLVLTATGRQEGDAEEAMEKLCRAYWYPLYGFLRRSGRAPHDAKDLIQGFFVHLLAKESRLQSAHPIKGKFRSFLLACLKNYVANRDDWDRVRSPKQPLLSIDEVLAEERYLNEPASLDDPATLYERQWAFALVEQTLGQLREMCRAEGKLNLFEALSPHLSGSAARGDYAQIAARLATTEGAIRTETSRLKDRYRELLLREVAKTVGPGEVEEEVRALFALFAR